MDTDKEHTAPGESCAECGATLVADQRYCLRCGARRGRPRLDFTAFYGKPSATGAQPEPGDARSAGGERRVGALMPSRRLAPMPSRRLAGALAAAALAGGIAVGATLGPASASSPTVSSTLVESALAALAARAGSAGGTSTGASTPAAKTATTTTAPAKSKSKPAGHTASSQAGGGGSSSSEPSESAPSSSEGSSSESSSSSSSSESSKAQKTTPSTPAKLPPISHVWLIALNGSTFAAAAAQPASYPYVEQLTKQGTLLSDYSALEGYELAGDATLLTGGVGQSLSVIAEPACATTTTSAGAPSTGTASTGATSTGATSTNSPCDSGAQTGRAEADSFLQQVLGPILASSSYRERGLILITFGTASENAGLPAAGPQSAGSTTESGAGSTTTPSAETPAITLTVQPVAGALVLSPTLRGGTQISTPFTPLAPRESLEAIFKS